MLHTGPRGAPDLPQIPAWENIGTMALFTEVDSET